MIRFAPLLVVAFVAGCARNDSANANPLAGGTASTPTPTAEKPTPDKPVEKPATSGALPDAPKNIVDGKPTPAQRAEIVALRNPAYDYYGLGLRKPIRMEIKADTGGIRTGTQETVVTAVEDGKVYFNVTRTGGLSELGDNELRLEKDGVYVQSSTRLKVGAKDLELPSDLRPGRSWTATTESTATDEATRIAITTTSTVVGPRSVKTKVGAYADAILVTATGKGISGGRKVNLSVKQWFVRGRGPVKSEFVSTYDGGASTKYAIQEVP